MLTTYLCIWLDSPPCLKICADLMLHSIAHGERLLFIREMGYSIKLSNPYLLYGICF
ncbi:hypothetical protein C0J52_06793 [Blattella germanica]|nr:hypothetical protein C0J52_06793 [Blattella germanica]